MERNFLGAYSSLGRRPAFSKFSTFLSENSDIFVEPNYFINKGFPELISTAGDGFELIFCLDD